MQIKNDLANLIKVKLFENPIEIGQIADLHEGLPKSFINLIQYLCQICGQRGRLNIYNITRHFHLTPDIELDTEKIREFLGPNKGIFHQWILPIGSRYNEKISLQERLYDYWQNILLPSLEEVDSLHPCFIILDLWKGAFLSDIFSDYLPKYQTTKDKSYTIRQIIFNIFSTPETYHTYKQKVCKSLPTRCQKLLAEIEEKEWRYDDLKRVLGNEEQGNIFYDIACLHFYLLAFFSYRNIGGKLYLFVSSFQSFEKARILQPISMEKPLPLPNGLEMAVRQTDEILTSKIFSKHSKSFLDSNLILREIEILKQNCPCFEEIIPFLKWWYAAISIHGLSFQVANELSTKIYKCGNKYYPLIIQDSVIKKIIMIAIEYGLLYHEQKKDVLQMTSFGMVFTCEQTMIDGIEVVWGRNRDILTITLPQHWACLGDRFLKKVAQEEAACKYVISKDDLAKKAISEKELFLILSSFFELTPWHIQRLRKWIFSSDFPCVKKAVTLSKQNRLLKDLNFAAIPWEIQETKDYYVLLDVSPKEVETWLQKQLPKLQIES